ncbi:DUF3168 domain-containing protein [Ensifer soli]|uniref:DUF3168 domain-containing protein n=1 Tax=Ciceribacter sp. sgz301302 TaxID=3342379 RepID=UPI0035BB6867
MSAASALQAAIFARLSGDADLTAVVGADGIADRLVPRTAAPRIVIARIDSRDRSTSDALGEEHLVTIEARAGEGGHRVVEALAARIGALLTATPLVLDGFDLVLITVRRCRVGRDPRAKGHVAEMTVRALTE